MATDTSESIARFEITGDLGRHDAESLRLHIRSVAKRCGVDLRELVFELVEEDPSAQSG